MKYAALVVTYYPDKDVFENIFNIQNQIENLVVIDNSNIPTSLPKELKGNILRNYNSGGLAGGINKGIKYLLKKFPDIEGIFIFDQDTNIPENYINFMINFKKSVNDPKVLIYAPNFYDINSKTFASFIKFGKYSLKKYNCSKGKIIFPTLVITSGILLDVKAIEKVGYFNENYLIDQIDNEYCIRLWKSGFKVAVNCDITIYHSIGNRESKKFLFLNIKPNNHNSFRRFLIIRNSLLTTKKYFYSPVLIWELSIVSHEFLSVILFEKEKKKKLKAMFKGLYKGLTD